MSNSVQEAPARALLALWKSDKELTVYKICQRIGLGRSSVAHHIQNLVETRIVAKRIYGEILLYTIKRNDLEQGP